MDSFGDKRQLLLNIIDDGKFTDILLLDMIKVVTINKLNVKKIKLKRYDESSTNYNRRIICQKDCDLFSTENRKFKIMNASSIRKEIVSARLNSNECNLQFYFQTNNECYRAYTHSKGLSKVQVKTSKQVYSEFVSILF